MMPCRSEMTSLWLTESIALAQRWPITLPLVIDPIRMNPIPITDQIAGPGAGRSDPDLPHALPRGFGRSCQRLLRRAATGAADRA